ncbi:MAG: preprotein translocase subunit SecG [Rickettsiales bacterium]
MYTVLLVIHTLLVLFLIGLVLIQRSSSDGMGGLGGGGGGGNQFLTGRGQANLLTRTTAILAGAFMVTSLILAIMASRMSESSIVDAIEAEDTLAPITSEMPAEEKPVPAPVVPKPE